MKKKLDKVSRNRLNVYTVLDTDVDTYSFASGVGIRFKSLICKYGRFRWERQVRATQSHSSEDGPALAALRLKRKCK
jgi:hypothetical protein